MSAPTAADASLTDAQDAPEHGPNMLDLLTLRIEDGETFLREVRGKKLKAQFKRLLRTMVPGDELWNWSWSAERGDRFSYAYGWCVVRAGVVVAQEEIHGS